MYSGADQSTSVRVRLALLNAVLASISLLPSLSILRMLAVVVSSAGVLATFCFTDECVYVGAVGAVPFGKRPSHSLPVSLIPEFAAITIVVDAGYR